MVRTEPSTDASRRDSPEVVEQVRIHGLPRPLAWLGGSLLWTGGLVLSLGTLIVLGAAIGGAVDWFQRPSEYETAAAQLRHFEVPSGLVTAVLAGHAPAAAEIDVLTPMQQDLVRNAMRNLATPHRDEYEESRSFGGALGYRPWAALGFLVAGAGFLLGLVGLLLRNATLAPRGAPTGAQARGT
jgi:hypothetical protein